MKKFSITLLSIGLLVPSFSTYTMFKSLINRVKQFSSQKTTKTLQKIVLAPDIQTPNKYYRYDIYHTPWGVEEWLSQKNTIELAIKNTDNDFEVIKNIVNCPATNGRHKGQTPLCRAAEMNDLKFVAFLLQNGAQINNDVRGIYGNDPDKFSTKALSFVRTYEMLELFCDNGADLHNCHVIGGGNILHMMANSYHPHDIRMFDYAISQGINVDAYNAGKGNLWHSLMAGIYRHSEEDLLNWAAKLNDQMINPYHKDADNKSAIDMIEESIKSAIEYLNSDNPFKLRGENEEKCKQIAKFKKLRDHMRINTTTKFTEITKE
jgi:hypothetical protein